MAMASSYKITSVEYAIMTHTTDKLCAPNIGTFIVNFDNGEKYYFGISVDSSCCEDVTYSIYYLDETNVPKDMDYVSISDTPHITTAVTELNDYLVNATLSEHIHYRTEDIPAAHSDTTYFKTKMFITCPGKADVHITITNEHSGNYSRACVAGYSDNLEKYFL